MIKAENIDNIEKEVFQSDLEVELDEGVYEINLNKLDELSEVEVDALSRLAIILDTLKL